MKAPHGGSVTVVGCTRFDFPDLRTPVQEEYFKLLFQQNVTAAGEAQARQKVPVRGHVELRWRVSLDADGAGPAGRPGAAHLHGHASHAQRHAPGLDAVSDSTLAVNVAVGGVPLDSARVTVYRADQEFASALTDAAGNVTLAVRPADLGTLTLTVTGFNCRPYQASVLAGASAYPALAGGASSSMTAARAVPPATGTGSGTQARRSPCTRCSGTTVVRLRPRCRARC